MLENVLNVFNRRRDRNSFLLERIEVHELRRSRAMRRCTARADPLSYQEYTSFDHPSIMLGPQIRGNALSPRPPGLTDALTWAKERG